MKNYPLINTAITFLMIFSASQLTGCASTGSNNADSRHYRKPLLVSSSFAISANDDVKFDNLIAKMDKAGYEFNKINNPMFDEIGKTMAVQFKRQKTLLVSYHSKLKDHRDIASFLNANKGKNQNELKEEIVRFDSNAKNESEKISSKIKAFDNATNEINKQNIILANQLLNQGLKITGLVKDKGLDTFVTASGFLAITQLNNIRAAYNEVSGRLALGKQANKVIDTDLQTINMVKETQKLVHAKVM